jgi:hypothetical protein
LATDRHLEDNPLVPKGAEDAVEGGFGRLEAALDRVVAVHQDFRAMLPDVSSHGTKGEQRMLDLLQIEVVGSKSDWFVLGLDKYGIVWSGTPRPVGATFELDWVQIKGNITKKE